ncbi:uncharacterized protein IUM83_17620 [Phytophthora cinnamomi]|uniref:uncharacterized protein n=1 Tax=Phytophthora cinnamomi TaxID=4785 RepID=UPI003559AB48|nr:hypothetical protein IUM83_17620 [Phytophthora cinnamomi]
MRVKGEREELRQLEIDLSKQIKEIIEVSQGANTSPQTDLVLSKSLWKQVAEEQKERQLHAENEKPRLLMIVNSQVAYLESLGLTLRECATWMTFVVTVDGNGAELDDRGWLRLKSSDAATYEIFLQEVQDNYARLHNLYGGVEYTQYVNTVLLPLSFEALAQNVGNFRAKVTTQKS